MFLPIEILPWIDGSLGTVETRDAGSLYAVFKLKKLRAKVWESTFDP